MLEERIAEWRVHLSRRQVIHAVDVDELEDHLQSCPSCRRELEELVQFKEHLAMIQFKEPTDDQLQRYWGNVYNRLERGIGWICFSLGAILLLCWGALFMVSELLQDSEVSMAVKIGVVSLVIGLVVLFVSIARERLTTRKRDKYTQEVER